MITTIPTCKKYPRYTVLLVVVFVLFIAGLAEGKSDNREIIGHYEQIVQEAARKWLNKNYNGALNAFYSAKELLLFHMPNHEDTYSWNTFFTLKIYTVLLTRLAEIELYQAERHAKLADEVKKEALDWAVVLEGQMKVWKSIKSPSPADNKIRLKWAKRIQAVVRKVKN